MTQRPSDSGDSGGPEGGGDVVSRVVANLTHELKTPLHSMLAVAQVLLAEIDGPLNEEQKRQVGIILRNGEHLLELIVGILNFSSSREETHRLSFREVEIKQLFEDVISGLRHVAEKGGVRLESDFSLLAERFCTDKALVRRIVENLLSNAVKFSPGGGVISVYAKTLSDGGLQFGVADSGIGINREAQGAIFREFYQADRGDTKRFGGVGLGLALVKAALDRLGGSVDVKSEPNRGSLFTVTVPSSSNRRTRRKILIAERDEGVRLTLEECFRREGYESFFVDSLADVFRKVGELRPELILLDISPPVEEGFSVISEIKKSAWGAELPVIIMSALDGPRERSRGFECGASDFIVKPFDVTELIARVQSQLE